MTQGDTSSVAGLGGPIALFAWGALQVAGGVVGLQQLTEPPGLRAVCGVSVALGVALITVGLLAAAFRLVTRRSVEWFVAWRYLRATEVQLLGPGADQSPLVRLLRGMGHRKTLTVGIFALALTLALFVASSFWNELAQLLGMTSGPPLSGSVPLPVRVLQGASLGFGLLGFVVTFFGILLVYFSLFTSISVFGVFLGTAALVIVLSVMGGFESDLRGKILGTTAHVVVDRPGAMFGGYTTMRDELAGRPDVVAATPYLESEVMVTSPTNLSGVLLRGIDPHTAGKVTNLDRYLQSKGGAGRLSNLLKPEKLAKIPATRFRPLVSEPMGKPPVIQDEDEPDGGKADRDARATGVDPEAQPPGDDPHDMGPKQDPATGDTGKETPDKSLKTKKKQKSTPRTKIPPRPIRPGIIVGAELSKNLRLYVGDDVNVIAPLGGMSPMGPIPKSKPFRVAGIFYSGMYEYDTKFAYITIRDAQRFLGLDNVVSGIEVKVKSMEAAGPLADRIRADLAGKKFRVRDWRQINQNLFSALKLERLVMFIVLTFIVLVASFSIITTLIMVVLEKRREIAALKSMGTTDGSVLKIFLYTGLYIGTIGMLVGLFSAVGFCLFLKYVGLPLDPEVYYISRLPVEMSIPDITLVALASVTLSFSATLYPALLAARLKPVEGLRRYQ